MLFEREDISVYCQNCGREFKADEKFCTACGAAATEAPTVQVSNVAVAEAKNAPTPKKEKKQMNIFAIIGFVVSLVCFLGIIQTSVIGPLAGLIFSIVALVQIKKNNQKGKGLAVAGVILGSIATLVSLVVLIITAIFSYAVPGFFRLLLTWVFPELFSMLGDYVGTSVSDAMNSFFSDAGAELTEAFKEWLESVFQ